MKPVLAAISVVFLFGSSGCSSLGYLLQATKGQLELSNRARPIEEVVKDEKTPPRLRELLAEIPRIKKFGEENGLKPTKNYTEYVKLDRDAAVYVVTASEPLRFKAREWRFPIVGSFPYLGWFDVKNANSYADELRKENLDVYVRGAAAYSTLGWFRDAILSTMIPEGDAARGELVNVVLHESMHATHYISGQSFFDESVAKYVGDQLTIQYLDRYPGQSQSEKAVYLERESAGERIQKRMHEAYERLERLYASALPDDEKAAEKKKYLEALKAELKAKREINNATLIQYKTYNTGVGDFDGLFKACGSDWKRFLEAIRGIDGKSFSEPQQENLAAVLRPVTENGCQGRKP